MNMTALSAKASASSLHPAVKAVSVVHLTRTSVELELRSLEQQDAGRSPFQSVEFSNLVKKVI